MQFVFILSQEGFRSTLKVSCIPHTTPQNQAFLKNKKRFGTSLPASFSA